MRTWNGEPGWDADPELRSAKLVIAPPGAPLTALLRARAEWHVAHEDATAVVFVPTTDAPRSDTAHRVTLFASVAA